VSSGSLRKPMATVTASPLINKISAELATLQEDKHIQAVYSQWMDDIYVVWVGIRDDSPTAREAAYRIEDEVSENFPQVLFDFHVIALPEGKSTDDYISNAQVIFQRSA
jgi:hypothetical protein